VAKSIAVIAGDGIGTEVVPAAMRCIDAALAPEGHVLHWHELDWSSARYHREGAMMPADGIEQLDRHDAIFLGAVGDPSIPDVETLWGLLIPIRRRFDQYVNLRPVRMLDGVPSPLGPDARCDIVIVRENSEGEYSELGGRFGDGDDAFAVQNDVFTRRGVRRIARYAYELARSRRRDLTSATKSNGIIHTMPFWDENVTDVGRDFPDVASRSVLIDALAADIVRKPGSFDVIVASNLFGDILSDLAAAVAGSIGIAPSANVDPSRMHPSMFEPVHGSAPDIAGRGIANPVAQIWSGVLMLEHLGLSSAAHRLMQAVEDTVREGVLTPDLGGDAGTADVADAVVARLAPASH